VHTGPFATAGAVDGPYDAIILEGAVRAVPSGLLAQLKPKGRLVALIAVPGKVPVVHLYARSGDHVAASAAFDGRLPPLMQAADPGFVF
jgi:protein-L-isoaspartate(D-aspartate) O-methyltransferase